MRQLLACAFIAGSLAAPASSEPVRGMRGEWSGLGFQVGPDGYQDQWTIELDLDGRKEARIAYPSLGCTGVLKLLKGDSRQAEYSETITSGPCVDGGRIIVRRAEGRMSWFWYSPSDPGVDASAVLYPSGLVS